MSTTRIERDTMGEMEVPSEALYGASTQRAVLNFPVSGEPVEAGIIHAYGLIKWAAARVNGALGEVDKSLTGQIEAAAEEVYLGKLDEHFPVDVYQTGSGTSTNMKQPMRSSPTGALRSPANQSAQKSPSTQMTMSTRGSPQMTPSRRQCI